MFRTLLLVTLFICASCTCPNNKSLTWREENGKIKVLTTIAMIDDLVARVGGEDLDTLPLIRDELDPHSYELVKGDDEKFTRADVIFYNGLGLEHGLSLRQHLDRNPKAVAISQPLLESGAVLEAEGSWDPHVWMDVSLWARGITPIVETLCTVDPDHAEGYRMRGEALRRQMLDKDAEIFAQLQSIPQQKRYLVTSHDAFNYFTRRYLAEEGEIDWRRRCAAPEGLAPDAQLSVTDLIEIVDHIDRFAITVVFPESNVNRDALRKIVRSTKEKGMPLRLCEKPLYGDSMGAAGSYLDMISHNANVIAEALTQE